LAFLRAAGQPEVRALATEKTKTGAAIRIPLKKNAVVHVRLLHAEKTEEPGYDYAYYCGK